MIRCPRVHCLSILPSDGPLNSAYGIKGFLRLCFQAPLDSSFESAAKSREPHGQVYHSNGHTAQYHFSILVTFPVVVGKNTQGKQFKNRRPYVSPQFSVTAHHDGRIQQQALEAAGPRSSTYQEAAHQCFPMLCSASFLLFIQSRLYAWGMVPPTFSVGTSTLVDLTNIIPHRSA